MIPLASRETIPVVERWHAHGNVYGVVTDPLTAQEAREAQPAQAA